MSRCYACSQENCGRLNPPCDCSCHGTRKTSELEMFVYPTSDCAPTPDAQGLGRLYQQIDELAQAEAEEEAAAERLEEAKKRRIRLEQEILPETMKELRLKDATSLSTGVKAKMVTKLRSSMAESNDRREEGFDWLVEHGHGDIVKNSIIVDLPKEAAGLVERIVGSLKRFVATQPYLIEVKNGRSVHNGQLNAVLKEALKAAGEGEGPQVPKELFKAFEQTFVEIERPKKRE